MAIRRIAVLQSGYSGFFPRFFEDLSLRDESIVFKAFMPNSGLNKKQKNKDIIIWGSRINWMLHYNIYRITGIQDLWSVYSTLDLIIKLKRFNPDIIHLHVINDCNLCFPIFVKFINHLNKPVVWTFHDTRTITARCASFEEDQCFQWKTSCKKCPKNAIYKHSIFNNVRLQWKLNKKWFNSINNLTIVTPSKWLANYVNQSFLSNKQCIIINNGINTDCFSFHYNKFIPQIENITGKIILGVAVSWEHRKGLDTMIWLSRHLPLGYQIVLVGGIKQGLEDTIPSNIICIPRTKNKEELISIYQKADVFINPTLADNFPTVNIEALGAGTPVVTFDTGGSPEVIDSSCGIVVEKGNNKKLLQAIINVCTHTDIYTKENCINRSKLFSLKQFDKYINLYKALVNKQ